MSRVPLLLLLSSLLACAQGPAGNGGSPARVLTVKEALAASGTQEQFNVEGYVLAHPDGTVLLCSGLAGSHPPQCGRPALTIRNLDITNLPGADHASGVSWTGKMTLHGTLRGTVLTVAPGPTKS